MGASLGVSITGLVVSFTSALVKVLSPFAKGHIDVAIEGLDDLVSSLEAKLAENESILQSIIEKLKNYRKELHGMRKNLESLAKETISKCDILIKVLSKETLEAKDFEYAGSRMIQLVGRSLQLLEEFQIRYKKINRNMSTITAELKLLKAQSKFDPLEVKEEKKLARSKFYKEKKIFLIPFVFLSFEADVKEQGYEAKVAEEKGEKLNAAIDEQIKKTMETEEYIEKELDQLKDWERALNVMKPDFTSDETLKNAKEVCEESILTQLKDLRDACNSYLTLHD